MAEISEKVQPPRNITSLHFDPPGLVSFKLESEEKKREGKIIYNDLEVAHRHGDFRLPFLVELKLQNVENSQKIVRNCQNRRNRRKTSRDKGKNQQQTQPT